MAKIITVWAKNLLLSEIADKLFQICKNLEPDNIIANPPVVYNSEKWAYGIMNPISNIRKNENAVALGDFISSEENWDHLKSHHLDGSFALFRNAKEGFEFVSDHAGSRSIWYYKDDDFCIASTSQRAIVMFLGSFELNEKVFPWILSSGTLGPFLSWDKRIKLLPPNSVFKMDYKTWEVSIKSVPIIFSPIEWKFEVAYEKVVKSVQETFSNLKIDFRNWGITLSGGKDSRGILLTLINQFKENKDCFRTFTYGHSGSELRKGTDAHIASLVANKYGVKNEFFPAHNLSETEAIETVCERILKVGEGRIDHFSGYMDGLLFWKYLFESGIDGILRGDIGFGFPLKIKFKNSKEAHFFGNSYLCRDIDFPVRLKNEIFMNQDYPEYLKPKKNESFNVFHDRFYQNFRIPMVLAALSDFKLSYVEIISPLLSGKILNVVKSLTENHRFGSPIWSSYLKELESDIPYSRDDTHENYMELLSKKEFHNYQTISILNSEYLTEELKSMTKITSNVGDSFLKKLKKMVNPRKIKPYISDVQWFFLWRFTLGRKDKKNKIPTEKLRNRLFILAKMPQILSDDALILKKNQIHQNSNP